MKRTAILAISLWAAAFPAALNAVDAPSPDVTHYPQNTPGSPRPLGSSGDWVDTPDYPSDALRKGAQGTTRFELSVGVDGKVDGCTVTVSSGNTELDDTTCSLIRQRALFRPARNEKGKPTRGTYYSAVRWTIPATDAVPVPNRFSLDFDTLVDGSLANCSVISVTGKAADKMRLGPMTCPDGIYEIPLDSNGNPHAKHDVQSFEFVVSDAK